MKAIAPLIPFGSILFASSSDKYSVAEEIFGSIVGLTFLALFIYLYFLPSIIAFKNKKKSRFIILLINIFFGGTGLGWLVALALALNKD